MVALNGVLPEDSFDGARWQRAREIADELGAPLPLGVCLAGRDYTRQALAEMRRPEDRNLSDRVSALLDSGCVEGMDAAAQALMAAARGPGPVGILCDYDVDGGTSQAILAGAIRLLGSRVPPSVLVPERNSEGFGPNPELLAKLPRACRLLCVLDCGTESEAMLASFMASRPGLQVLIVDHHPRRTAGAPDSRLLRVNPAAQGASGEVRGICAAGLSFLLAVRVLQRLTLAPDSEARGRARAFYREALVLGAFGTVCDVMELVGFNRALVRMASSCSPEAGGPGMAALCQVLGISGPLSARHFGWDLGPCVNSGSRMGQSGLGAALLREREPERAFSMARELVRLNRERKTWSARMLEEFLPHVPCFEPPVTIFLAQEGPPGVAGIAAASLARLTGFPAIVLAPRPGGGWAGSGRSVPGFDLGAAVHEAMAQGHLVKGGGHAMACGMEVLASHLDAAYACIARALGDPHPPVYWSPAEASLDSEAADCGSGGLFRLMERLCAAQGRLEPLGRGWPLPLYRWTTRIHHFEESRGGHIFGSLSGKVPFAWFRQGGGLQSLASACGRSEEGFRGKGGFSSPDGVPVVLHGTVQAERQRGFRFIVERGVPAT